MGPGPLFCRLNGRSLIILPALGDIVGERIVGIRGSEQSLNRQKNCTDLQSGGPVVWTSVSSGICDRAGGRTLQDIQADTTKAVDVGMVDLRQETDLWGSHGIVIGKKEFQPEDATCSTECWSLEKKNNGLIEHTLIR